VNSCSTSYTRRVNLVTNPVISHEWRKDRLFLFTVYFISTKPLLSDHLSYATIFNGSIESSHKTGFTINELLLLNFDSWWCRNSFFSQAAYLMKFSSSCSLNWISTFFISQVKNYGKDKWKFKKLIIQLNVIPTPSGVDLYFFLWSLCCLFLFDLRILITPLVSSNSSFDCLQLLWP
jgi:hypothetical protein